MKLHYSLLEKLISLPSSSLVELRQLLDDVGLEVKGIDGEAEKTIFTIETLANRGDHLSAWGVARELSARLLCSIKHPALASELSDRKASIPVRKTTELCSRYALLEMSLPASMKLRSDIAAFLNEPDPERHPIVHLLNYILLELGQPMHAFDRDKIEGEVVVDCLTQDEKIEALDGKTYQVPSGALVIRDKKKIIAVAGVIGCSNSMVTRNTTRVLIESACFNPVSVRITARAMGISTDASYAFERGSDVENVLVGLKRLAHLCGGSGGAVSDGNSGHVLGLSYIEGDQPEKRKISLKLEMIRKNINSPRLDPKEVHARLKNLGYVIESSSDDKELKILVPTWRLWDVRDEQDILEDFARSYGLNRVKLELPALDYQQPELHPNEKFLALIEPVLIGAGFFEVITKGFYSAEQVAMLESLSPGISQSHIGIKNSVERSYSHLKITNILHMAELAERNHRQGLLACKIYEFGRLFSLPEAGKTNKNRNYEFERDTVTLAASGRWYEHEWQKPEALAQQLMLFKGTLENLLRSLGLQPELREGKNPLLHPGYQAEYKQGRDVIGSFGLIHPALKSGLDLRQDFIYAELDAEFLMAHQSEVKLAPSWEYPSVRRDITLKVPVKGLAGQIANYIDTQKPANLIDTVVVDNFKKAEEDFRRVTYRLTFRSHERTLSSAEVDNAMQQILADLKSSKQLELA